MKTIRNRPEFKLKEKKSLFIGRAYQINSQAAAEDILTRLKKEYFDSRHICYAYEIVTGTIKYSDDGEPGGTAGIRIYNAIKHFELINVFTAVIRYFGGVKLGAGPLGKAYYSTAFSTLELADIIEKKAYGKITLNFDFENTDQIHKTLDQFAAKKIRHLYEKGPEIECLIELDAIESFISSIEAKTRGSAKIKIKEEKVIL